jgi:hypothetical protein
VSVPDPAKRLARDLSPGGAIEGGYHEARKPRQLLRDLTLWKSIRAEMMPAARMASPCGFCFRETFSGHSDFSTSSCVLGFARMGSAALGLNEWKYRSSEN